MEEVFEESVVDNSQEIYIFIKIVGGQAIEIEE